ncbi:hypothetical protein COP2_021530 [Malus domestica]
MENAKKKREVMASKSRSRSPSVSLEFGRGFCRTVLFSAKDFAELPVRRNLEIVVVGWESGFSFLGLNCGGLG